MTTVRTTRRVFMKHVRIQSLDAVERTVGRNARLGFTCGYRSKWLEMIFIDIIIVMYKYKQCLWTNSFLGRFQWELWKKILNQILFRKLQRDKNNVDNNNSFQTYLIAYTTCTCRLLSFYRSSRYLSHETANVCCSCWTYLSLYIYISLTISLSISPSSSWRYFRCEIGSRWVETYK